MSTDPRVATKKKSPTTSNIPVDLQHTIRKERIDQSQSDFEHKSDFPPTQSLPQPSPLPTFQHFQQHTQQLHPSQQNIQTLQPSVESPAISEIILDISQLQNTSNNNTVNYPQQYELYQDTSAHEKYNRNKRPVMDSTAYDLSPLLREQPSSLPQYLQPHHDHIHNNHQQQQQHQTQYQSSEPCLIEYDEINLPPYLTNLYKLSATVSNSHIFMTKYPIKKAYIQSLYAAPRFLSLVDAIKLPKELKAIENCPHLDGTIFTRESMINAFQQSSPFQRYNNFNHPSMDRERKHELDPRYSFSLLGAYNHYRNNINPGKFVILGLSWNQQPLKSLQYQLLHQNHSPGNSHYYPPTSPPKWLASPSQTVRQLAQGVSNPVDNNIDGNLDFVYQPPTLYNQQIDVPQTSLYCNNLTPMLCKELRAFQPKLQLKHVIPIELSHFQHHAWSCGMDKKKKKMSRNPFDLISHLKINPPYTSSFCSSSLLYQTVNGYKLTPTQRLVLYEKLFNHTISRIVLNSYLQYEAMVTKQLHQQQLQERETAQFDSTTEHFVRYDNDDNVDGRAIEPRYADDTDAKEDHQIHHHRDKKILPPSQLRQHPSFEKTGGTVNILPPTSSKSLFTEEHKPAPISHEYQHHHQHHQHHHQSTTTATITANQSQSDLDDLATFTSTFQSSKMIYNHFHNNHRLRFDYRMGMRILNDHMTILLDKFHMDHFTPILPFSLLLHISRQHLHHVAMPCTYMALPIEYLLAMQGLDDPRNFAPPPSQPSQNQQQQQQLMNDKQQVMSPNVNEFIHTPQPQSDFGFDELDYGHEGDSAELLLMKTHHVVQDPSKLKFISTKETIDATWKSSTSPLSHWILQTRNLQHEAFSQSLKSTIQNERYNNFFKLKSRYALTLYGFLKDLNIYDTRLSSPQAFTAAIKSARGQLNHITMEMIIHHDVAAKTKGHIDGDGRSTSCGIFQPQLVRLFNQFGSRLWLNHTSHKLTATTSSHGHHDDSNGSTHYGDQNNNPRAANNDHIKKKAFDYYCPIYSIPCAQSLHAIQPTSSSLFSSLSSSSSQFLQQFTPLANAIASIITQVPSNIAFALSNQLPTQQQSSIISSGDRSIASSSTSSSTSTSTHPSRHHRRASSSNGDGGMLSTLFFGMSSATEANTLKGFRNGKKIAYSPIFPHYPCDNLSYNNLGRCYSILIAMNNNYTSTHLIPRINFYFNDIRRAPQKLVTAFNDIRMALKTPYPDTAAVSRKFWFKQRYEYALKRQIIANSIRKGTFIPVSERNNRNHDNKKNSNNNSTHDSLTVSYRKLPPNNNSTTTINNNNNNNNNKNTFASMTNDSQHRHPQHHPGDPILPNPWLNQPDIISPNASSSEHHQHQQYVQRMFSLSDQQADQQYQEYHQRQQQQQQHQQSFQIPQGQSQDEQTDIVTFRPQRPIYNVTTKMLRTAKYSLSQVFDHGYINIYEGDTINQHSIRGVFELIGENNWQYQGNPTLLVRTDFFKKDSVIAQFFSKLFK